MGGQAIKIAERIPKERFFKYTKEIIPRVQRAFNTEVHMVNGYHNKKDFGDLDLLVLADRDFGDRTEIIRKEFDPKEIFKNGHVISFSYKGEEIKKEENEYLQVDLIFTPPSNWEPSKVFFDWGDLGNFMGKLINSYGNLNNHGYLLKYGYDGLKCKLVHGGKTEKIYLTKDNRKVFEFLGLDFDKWKEGFNNREEMFDYVISSPLFNYKAFQWENISSVNKHRNKRRPNYYTFLEYIEKHKERTIEWGDPDQYLDILKDTFGVDLKQMMEQLKRRVEEDKLIKQKFNGREVMNVVPGLQGKDLGDAIQGFKSHVSDWRNYALSSDKERIIKDFKNWYKSE